ncbi:MAG: hypothetical protein KAQ70_04175 [Candidatus Heimdallarchaeota archaeon]|nr:hypothetical protein [Candidatus Heimdallarchaeota archaeon]
MRGRKIAFLLFTVTLFSVALFNVDFSYAGWEGDPVGDASKAYLDITNITVTKNYLELSLNADPYFNDSGAVNWRFYNIWVDTSMEDDTPDTTTWSTDVYEYVAHFDCRWNGDQWINNSYINAFRYYLTEDGSAQVTGSFYWDGNNWVGSDPNIDVADVSGNKISFDTEGALYREHPLGTGYVIQGIANTSNFTTVDIAPNNNWLDEFGNLCVEPDPEPEPEPEPTEGIPFSLFGLLVGITFLGVIGASIRKVRRMN